MAQHIEEWSAVATWDPDLRYRSIGTVTEQQAARMINSIKVLVAVL